MERAEPTSASDRSRLCMQTWIVRWEYQTVHSWVMILHRTRVDAFGTSRTESAPVHDAALPFSLCNAERNVQKTMHARHFLSGIFLSYPFQTERNPTPLSLPSQPSPCPEAAARTRFSFRGLTVLVLRWCRCEETPNAGKAEEATAPLLRDRRRTDLHTFAAISGVKPGRENASAAGEPTESVGGKGGE